MHHTISYSTSVIEQRSLGTTQRKVFLETAIYGAINLNRPAAMQELERAAPPRKDGRRREWARVVNLMHK